ncbi:MAG: transglycosylase SLT domain-containing protein [Pseudobdellovibrionaceae bacterium]
MTGVLDSNLVLSFIARPVYTDEMKSIIKLSILSTLVTPALITMSCSHLSDRKEALTSQQESLLLAFQKAKSLEVSDPSGSCSLYSRLSKETFPLKTLSLIKAHLSCTDFQSLPAVTENMISEEPWLGAVDSDRILSEAERLKEPRALAQAHFKKSQKSLRPSEKIQLLEKALTSAKEISNATAEDQSLQKEIQARLYKLAPRMIPEPQAKDLYAVGMDYIYQRQFSKGRQFLKRASNPNIFSLEEQYQARRAYRNSFKTELKKEEHVLEAGKFAKWTTKRASAVRIHEAYTTWARAEWTIGQASVAKKILADAENLMRKKKYGLDEIYFIQARMAEEAKDLDQALSLLIQAEKETRPNSAFSSRILFNQAWLLRKKMQFPEAAEAFLKLKNQTTDTFEKNRTSFWLARSLKQSGKTDEANKELQELTQNDPLGYYGLVAYRELNLDIPPLQIEQKLAVEEPRPPAVDLKDHELIRALIFVGESEILGRYLDAKTSDLRSQQNMEQATWLYFLKAYARAGLYNPLFQQIGVLPIEFKSKLLAQNPELLFPRKFLDLIQAAGEKFKVRPELMLSIIRQESAFNPTARSSADAMGLMQVLPSVAKEHEKYTGLKLEHFEDLYKPEFNIPVGASLLADLGRKYRGQFLLTAAAYNANEKAIEGWLKTRLETDPLEFIEDIPYEETRAYVKLVLRNFIFYSRLAAPAKTLAFPNWCLEDLQSFKVSTR